MKSITFICPYFGTLPQNVMPLWLKCCKYNFSIHWIIFTDDTSEYDYPDNVSVIYTTLSEVKSRAQKLFDFQISLDRAYKLCDYKPLYGCIFEDYLTGVDFWGHCDISDFIFGNLRIFLTDDVLNNYDKILFLGHMTLYRNTGEVNNRFRIMTNSGTELKSIFGNVENRAFDEINSYSINTIYMENGFSLKRIDDMYVDVSCMTYPFRKCVCDEGFIVRRDKTPRVFYWVRGRLYDCSLDNGVVHKKEIGYVHFQKRLMKKNVADDCEEFYILPNGFFGVESKNLENVIQLNSKSKLFYRPFWVNKFMALKYRIKHICKG